MGLEFEPRQKVLGRGPLFATNLAIFVQAGKATRVTKILYNLRAQVLLFANAKLIQLKEAC